jgi:hypothetical protein
MNRKITLIYLSIGLFICSCSDVKPWQKSKLAKSHMTTDPDLTERFMTQRIYQSKEAARGGYGIRGGGCGCN